MSTFQEKVSALFADHEALITKKNNPLAHSNGIYNRYENPIVTAAHTPVFWRYDLNEKTNPYLMELIGRNAAMNSGAIKWTGTYVSVVRVDGDDRTSFFAIAESPTGMAKDRSGY